MQYSNPWKSIWTEPRATIASIVTENPNRSLWWLASILGFSSLLSSFQSIMIGYHVHLIGIFILAAVIAPFWGYISISIWSYLVMVMGKLLK